ncbi:MAG: hypothetical protein LBH28_12140, partial [Oscillospiraceae bacterium]|nr:hypothetical protein [Oscillospiraceae bacterium]
MRDFLQKIKQRRATYARAFFTAFVFLTMVFICYFFMNNTAHQQLLQNTATLLDYEQFQIESALLESEITLDGFSQTLRNMILQGDGAGRINGYIKDLSGYLGERGKYTSTVKGLYGYFETLPGGPVFLAGYDLNMPDDYDPTQSAWYQGAVAANGGVIEILENRVTAAKESIITYALCIYGDGGERLGVVCIDVSFDTIAENILQTAFEKNGSGCLIGYDLTILAHPNASYVNLHATDPVVPLSAFQTELESGREITERPMRNYLDQECVAFFRPLAHGWYVGLVIQKGPYYQSVTVMTIILFALGSTFAVALIVILTRIDTAHENVNMLLDTTPLSVNLWDKNLKLFYCNEETVKIFNLESRQEYIKRFAEFSPERQPDGELTKDKARRLLRDTFENGRNVFEWMHQTQDGTELPSELTLVRIPYGN